MTLAPLRSRASTRRLAGIASACLLFSLSLGGPSLLLTDGREIHGDDLRMEGDLYMLTAHGSVVPIPKQAVKTVKWVEDKPSKGSAPVANMVTSKTESERQQDAEHRAARDAERQAYEADQRAAEDAAQQQADQRRADAAASGPAYTVDSQGIRHWNQGGVVLAGPDIPPPTTQQQLAVFGEPAKFAPDVVEFDLHPTYWVPDPNEGVMEGMPPMMPPRNDTWVPTDGFAK